MHYESWGKMHWMSIRKVDFLGDMKFALSRHEIIFGIHVGRQQFHVTKNHDHVGFCASTTYDMKVYLSS